MTSAAPQKRMVSSVFITLASPFRATVTPTTHVHSSSARDRQRPTSSCAPVGSQDAQISPSAPLRALYSQSRRPVTQINPPAAPHRLPDNTDRVKHSPDVVTSYPPPPAARPAALDDLCTLPSPPHQHQPHDPRDPEPASPAPPAQVISVMRASASDGSSSGSQVIDVCGFCRKPFFPSETAIDALNRSYHASCFQCRQCHMPLAAKLYYNKSGIPLCEDCYQASLEPCWACGDVIKDHVIRALERAYHPPCFVCTTCRQPIGEQRFAQGEVGEVYCLQDYYRKYAPQCSACERLIIPRDDGTDSYTVECLGHSYHEDCYRCEVCGALLSPEPDEKGCYPLNGQILCKACHFTIIHNKQH